MPHLGDHSSRPSRNGARHSERAFFRNRTVVGVDRAVVSCPFSVVSCSFSVLSLEAAWTRPGEFVPLTRAPFLRLILVADSAAAPFVVEFAVVESVVPAA